MTALANGHKLIPAFYFSRTELFRDTEALRNKFLAAKPFPHLVIEDFLPQSLAEAIAEEFPQPDDIEWGMAGPGDVKHSGNKYIEKLSMSKEWNFPPLIRHVLSQLNSGVFIDFIEQVTGYSHIATDPTYCGGGMHTTGRGGRLMVHADASRHPNPKLNQVLNLIYYATPDWKDEYNGHLELWDDKLKGCVTRIAPKFNSAVLFHTGAKSFHGHPVPLTCPEGMRRNSLACYYYTTDRRLDGADSKYRNFADWRATSDLDSEMSPVHRAKMLVRNHMPTSIANFVAKTFRNALGRKKITS